MVVRANFINLFLNRMYGGIVLWQECSSKKFRLFFVDQISKKTKLTNHEKVFNMGSYWKNDKQNLRNRPLIETIWCMDGPLNIFFVYVDWKSKMTDMPITLTQDPMGEIFYNCSHLKPLYFAKMFLRWSSTKCVCLQLF